MQTGPVTQVYTEGQIIDVSSMVSKPQVKLTFLYKNLTKIFLKQITAGGGHGGWIELKVCPLANVNEQVTQECFDRYPLEILPVRITHLF